MAKKRAHRERRYRNLRLYCAEEREIALMELEDGIGHELLKEERALALFRRLLQGYLGRKEANARRVELARLHNIEWLAAQAQGLRDAERRKRERACCRPAMSLPPTKTERRAATSQVRSS